MEEYFRFPSPLSDTDSIMRIERLNSGNGVANADAPAPHFEYSESSRPALVAAGTLPSTELPFGGAGALANNNPARRQVHIKVVSEISTAAEETDERPRKRIKMVRRCGVCGKHGHNARTCREAAESSESAVSDVIVVCS